MALDNADDEGVEVPVLAVDGAELGLLDVKLEESDVDVSLL